MKDDLSVAPVIAAFINKHISMCYNVDTESKLPHVIKCTAEDIKTIGVIMLTTQESKHLWEDHVFGARDDIVMYSSDGEYTLSMSVQALRCFGASLTAYNRVQDLRSMLTGPLTIYTNVDGDVIIKAKLDRLVMMLSSASKPNQITLLEHILTMSAKGSNPKVVEYDGELMLLRLKASTVEMILNR